MTKPFFSDYLPWSNYEVTSDCCSHWGSLARACWSSRRLETSWCSLELRLIQALTQVLEPSSCLMTGCCWSSSFVSVECPAHSIVQTQSSDVDDTVLPLLLSYCASSSTTIGSPFLMKPTGFATASTSSIVSMTAMLMSADRWERHLPHSLALVVDVTAASPVSTCAVRATQQHNWS